MSDFVRGTGALPPPDFEWMMGRSVEEINAIREEAHATGKPYTEVATSDAWRARLIHD